MINSVEIDLGGGRKLSFETGRIAKQAGGSVLVRLGDTIVMAATVMAEVPRAGIDFFPLLIDFEEKLYAVGKIPGGFFKREGRPTEVAILTSRRVDRPIRPLFPKGFLNDVQIVITPLSVDQDNPPDILAINAASAALCVSDIPFGGPIAAARIAKVDGKYIVDPTMAEMKDSVMDLVVAGTDEAISMIECGSDEISEEEVMEGIKLAHRRIKEVIKAQLELMRKVGKAKREIKLYKPNEEIEKYVKKGWMAKIKAAMNVEDKDQQMDEIDKIKAEVNNNIKEGANEELKKLHAASPSDVKNVIDDMEREVVRRMVLEEGKRADGRGFKDIRQISCEVGVLPRAHGSAIFSRGQTQVLTVVTLGALGEKQRLEGLSPEDHKRYMHHYNFPAFSVGEVRPLRGPGRREIGHGALAEKALLPVVPNEADFPYAVRLVSEVLGSNGSTSMASTCGSTMALMDAGIKIKNPVAGISVGLIKEGNKEVLITDIQGMEDHLGDMDFKVAGTKNGITAIQLDIKIAGLSCELIDKALKQANEARMIILGKMGEVLSLPRQELSPYAPMVITLKIDPAKIGMVIGPGGKMIRKITEETGAKIDIEDDGTVLITATDPDGGRRAQRAIEEITFEPEVGAVFRGKVVRILPFGAFVEMVPGKEGLVHISEISKQRVAKVEDVLKIGDEAIVKVVEIDEMGRFNLSCKAVSPEEKEKLSKA